MAAVSTTGILVIAGMQVTTALKKTNTPDDQLAKTMVEIKNARKDALNNVKEARKEALNEVEFARQKSLKSIQTAGNSTTGDVYYLYWGTFTALKPGEVSRYASSHLSSNAFNSLEACENAGQRLLSEIYMPIKFFDGRYTCVKK